MNIEMTFESAVGPYLEYARVERLLANQTLVKYHDCFRAWLVPYLGNIELDSLTSQDITHMRSQMIAKKLGVQRQYSVLICLKTFLKFCRVRIGAQALDPATIVLPRREIPNPQYLTQDEIHQVLQVININTYDGSRLRALIELLLGTGLRISEALSLDRRPIDHETHQAEVIGKGKKRRTVFFSTRVEFWLRQYLDKRVDSNPALFVTTGVSPRRWGQSDLSRFFGTLKCKAGIEKRLTPHILRHTFCTNMRNRGADISIIKDLVGHSDIQTTARYYLGKSDDQLREAMNRFASFDE